MLGAGMQFNRSRGDDRCYNSKARRSYQSQQTRAQSDVNATQCKEKLGTSGHQQPGNRAAETSKSVGSPDFQPFTLPLSNVERFVEAVTPSVPAQYMSKTSMINWKANRVEHKPYFLLSDLWESFEEWSVYGAGVPLVLNGSDSVVQYYAPYLSAIQIYADPLKSQIKSRRASEDSDGDYSSRDGSDGSSDSERERVSAYSRGRRNHYQATNISCKMDRLSLVGQQTALQEGFSSDDGESGNSQGHLMFQYLENKPPYCREPLSEKIDDLALRFPDLKNLRSCDLSPLSWFSVAWYPIYRIPNGPTLKDLDACFLTYHSLHTPIQESSTIDVAGAQAPVLTDPKEMDGIPKMSLPVFGLASYKYRGYLWTSSNGTGRQLVNFLSQGAANWIRGLQVNHPDFEFFSTR